MKFSFNDAVKEFLGKRSNTSVFVLNDILSSDRSFSDLSKKNNTVYKDVFYLSDPENFSFDSDYQNVKNTIKCNYSLMCYYSSYLLNTNKINLITQSANDCLGIVDYCNNEFGAVIKKISCNSQISIINTLTSAALIKFSVIEEIRCIQ